MKAINVGAAFGIIFASIVIAFAFALGGDLIGDYFCISGLSQLEQAMAKVDDQVNVAYSLGYGSILDLTISVPQDSKFCFIDPANPQKNVYWNWNPDFATRYSLENPQNQFYGSNVWHFYCSDFSARKLSALRTTDNFCISGRATLPLENKGSYVEISPP